METQRIPVKMCVTKGVKTVCFLYLKITMKLCLLYLNLREEVSCPVYRGFQSQNITHNKHKQNKCL